MSVAQFSARELGLFVALQIKSGLVESTRLNDLCEIAERISYSNCAAWAARYSDTITAISADDVEREALRFLANPNELVRSTWYGFCGNYDSSILGDMPPEFARKSWEALRKVEKSCSDWQAAKQRELERFTANDAAYAECEPLEVISRDAVYEKCKAAKADRVIVASFHVDESDGYTDYNGGCQVRNVVIGFGRGKRENFKQLREAASKFEPTKHLGLGCDCWHVSVNRQPLENGYAPTTSCDKTFLTEAEATAWIEAEIAASESQDGLCAKHYGYNVGCRSIENRENYSMGGGNYLGNARYSGWKIQSYPVDNTWGIAEQIEYFEPAVRLQPGEEPPKPTKRAAPKPKPAKVVEIIESNATEYTRSIHARHGKTQAIVSVSTRSQHVTVCCLNAANRAWRGAGKTYRSFDHARQCFRSVAMLAIISRCEQILTKPPIADRVRNLAGKIKTDYQASKLWNWIDQLGPNDTAPEPLWLIMAEVCPWAFSDPANPNTLRFCYDRNPNQSPDVEPQAADYTCWL